MSLAPKRNSRLQKIKEQKEVDGIKGKLKSKKAQKIFSNIVSPRQ